jgi:hypothetical protein
MICLDEFVPTHEALAGTDAPLIDVALPLATFATICPDPLIVTVVPSIFTAPNTEVLAAGRLADGTTDDEFRGAYPDAAPLFAAFSGVNPNAACAPIVLYEIVIGDAPLNVVPDVAPAPLLLNVTTFVVVPVKTLAVHVPAKQTCSVPSVAWTAISQGLLQLPDAEDNVCAVFVNAALVKSIAFCAKLAAAQPPRRTRNLNAFMPEPPQLLFVQRESSASNQIEQRLNQHSSMARFAQTPLNRLPQTPVHSL